MSNTINFKGVRYTHSRKAVTLPREPGDPYVRFGYAEWGATDDQGGKLVKTQWTTGSGEPIFAKPIPIRGHGLTNLAYGKNGYAYLLHDGRVYVRNTNKKGS
jgi:hypothetical protein